VRDVQRTLCWNLKCHFYYFQRINMLYLIIF